MVFLNKRLIQDFSRIDEKQQLTLKFKDKIDINKIKGILSYLNLDGHKKNWITGKINMENKI